MSYKHTDRTKVIDLGRKVVVSLTHHCHYHCFNRLSGQPSMPFVASVKEETDFWRNCLLEIKVGYKMADGRKKLILNLSNSS